MAKRFLTTLRLLNLSSDPGSASNGDVYYNSSSNKTKIYQNGSWKIVPSDLKDLSDVSISATPSDGQVLTYVNSTSRWENRSVSSSNPSSGTENGTSFPSSPSIGQFFFNTDVKKLFFFSNSWQEIYLKDVNIDSENSSTTSFDNVFDSGSSSTTNFDTGVYDAQYASILFDDVFDGGISSTILFTSETIDAGKSRIRVDAGDASPTILVSAGSSSTTTFESDVYNGGTSSTTIFESEIVNGGSSTTNFSSAIYNGGYSHTRFFSSGEINSGLSLDMTDQVYDGGSSYTSSLNKELCNA
jgi:hypothetical protein